MMPSQKKRPVRLTEADSEELVLTTTGVHPVSMIRRARVLLALDTSVGVAEEIEAVAHALNTRPRKTLDWKTPAEAFNDHLLVLHQTGVASTD